MTKYLFRLHSTSVVSSQPNAINSIAEGIAIPVSFPHDNASSGRIQRFHARRKPISRPCNQDATAGSRIKQAHLVLSELEEALKDSDPVKAWSCYYALTNVRTPSKHTVGESSMNSKIYQVPIPPSRICLIPESSHGKVLALVENLLQQQFAARHNITLPPYVIVTRVEHILYTMQSFNIKLKKNELHLVIDMYARTGQLNRLEFWLEQYKAHTHQIDLKTANSVLTGYINANRFKEALDWYDKMITEFHLNPNSFTYGQIFKLFSSLRDGNAVDRLWKAISSKFSLPPHPSPFLSFMMLEKSDSHSLTSEDSDMAIFPLDLPQVAEIFKAVERPTQRPASEMDPHLFLWAMIGYGRGGYLAHAFDVFYAYLSAFPVEGYAAFHRKMKTGLVQCLALRQDTSEWIPSLVPLFASLKMDFNEASLGPKEMGLYLQSLVRRNELERAHKLATQLIRSHMENEPDDHGINSLPIAPLWIDTHRFPPNAAKLVAMRADQTTDSKLVQVLKSPESDTEISRNFPISYPGLYCMIRALQLGGYNELASRWNRILRYRFPRLRSKRVWKRKERAI